MYHDSSQSPLLTSTFAIQEDLSLSNKEIIERLARLEEGQKASVDKLEYRKIIKPLPAEAGRFFLRLKVGYFG